MWLLRRLYRGKVQHHSSSHKSQWGCCLVWYFIRKAQLTKENFTLPKSLTTFKGRWWNLHRNYLCMGAIALVLRLLTYLILKLKFRSSNRWNTPIKYIYNLALLKSISVGSSKTNRLSYSSSIARFNLRINACSNSRLTALSNRSKSSSSCWFCLRETNVFRLLRHSVARQILIRPLSAFGSSDASFSGSLSSSFRCLYVGLALEFMKSPSFTATHPAQGLNTR